MLYQSKKRWAYHGLTMLEMVMALAIMAIVFAAILPQFKNIQNSWASRRGIADALQNGRVFTDHINHSLAQAARITAVSDPAETEGFIEFEDNNGDTMRYQLSNDNFTQFGDPSALYDLAGPVTNLQFTCYAITDLDTPITDPDQVRFVKVETSFANLSSLGTDRNFTSQVFLRTNTSEDDSLQPYKMPTSPFEFDTNKGADPALAKIDDTHYLCAYNGAGSDGWAVVLEVDAVNSTISSYTPFEFDAVRGKTPALSKIDDEHYLCAYSGDLDIGLATVLIVDTATWTISKGPTFTFDNVIGEAPALAPADSTHHLLAYKGLDSDGWAVILTVDTGTWTITKETPFEYDISRGDMPALIEIESEKYLCVYQGAGKDGWAVFLIVNAGTWSISKGPALCFNAIAETHYPAISHIKDNRYLCLYMNTMGGQLGWAIILTVNTASSTVSRGAPLLSDNGGTTPAVCAINETALLGTYAPTGTGFKGRAVVLFVDSDTGLITESAALEFDPDRGMSAELRKIADNTFLCVYEGSGSDGWAAIIKTQDEIRP